MSGIDVACAAMRCPQVRYQATSLLGDAGGTDVAYGAPILTYVYGAMQRLVLVPVPGTELAYGGTSNHAGTRACVRSWYTVCRLLPTSGEPPAPLLRLVRYCLRPCYGLPDTAYAPATASPVPATTCQVLIESVELRPACVVLRTTPSASSTCPTAACATPFSATLARF
eukprot:1375545-Rhodomonas_salina.2